MIRKIRTEVKNIKPPKGAKLIGLTKGKYAIVDSADYEYLIQFNWYINGKYAVAKINDRMVQMHRIILDLNHREIETDHKNKNGLDNRRSNLRPCTFEQNCMNRGPHSDSYSKYKGVYWDKRCRKWLAKITFEKKTKYIGIFSSEEDAGKAYDIKAKQLFGDFAHLNFPIV